VRLFVAAYPPAAALADLAGTVAGLALARPPSDGNPGPARGTGLIPAERWHLTVAFLGEVADERQPDVEAALHTAVRGWRTASGGPPDLRLAGGGRFGRGRFTTVWVGVRGEVSTLGDLAATVGRTLRRARLPCDRKPFRPHLTLARCGERLTAEQVATDIATLDRYQGPPWSVLDLHLVSSTPGPSPEHRTLSRVPLDGR
jgi:2'-5' RNA ligase